MKINWRKLSTGNWVGRYGKYHVFIFKRPHKAWCVYVREAGKAVASEGYHGTYLKNINLAKGWAYNCIDENEMIKSK